MEHQYKLFAVRMFVCLLFTGLVNIVGQSLISVVLVMLCMDMAYGVDNGFACT